MPKDVVTLFSQDKGSKLIKKHCRAIRLPYSDLKRLVEEVIDKSTMGRRHGLWQAFDEVLGESLEETDE
jgi:hypothetical protein